MHFIDEAYAVKNVRKGSEKIVSSFWENLTNISGKCRMNFRNRSNIFRRIEKILDESLRKYVKYMQIISKDF